MDAVDDAVWLLLGDLLTNVDYIVFALYGYGGSGSNNFHFIGHRNWIEVILLLARMLIIASVVASPHSP